MKPFFFLVLLACCLNIRAQPADLGQFSNYYDSIRRFDLSKLWRTDSILLEDNGTKEVFPEPIGFIGANFQRFDIHFLSVVKSLHQPHVYLVTGKTRVKGNISVFCGTMTVISARMYSWDAGRRYREGSVTCAVSFYEDSLQKGSGVITGRMETDFCLDKKRRLFYDALEAVADGYCNNQCIAVWRSYRTHISKKCNWGDYRIPESRALDNGAGVFHVTDEYVQNGWQNWENDTAAWWQ